jgi:hypothetical protein
MDHYIDSSQQKLTKLVMVNPSFFYLETDMWKSFLMTQIHTQTSSFNNGLYSSGKDSWFLYLWPYVYENRSRRWLERVSLRNITLDACYLALWISHGTHSMIGFP